MEAADLAASEGTLRSCVCGGSRAENLSFPRGLKGLDDVVEDGDCGEESFLIDAESGAMCPAREQTRRWRALRRRRLPFMFAAR